MKVCDIVERLEQMSDPSFAEEWDNVGLLVGSKEQEVKKVLISLDASTFVVDKAIKEGVDLLITHHPLIFSPMKQVNEDTITGQKVLHLIQNKIAYYAMHTNFDAVGSMADLAQNRLQLENAVPIEPLKEDKTKGMGRVGNLPKPMSVEECARWVKTQFNLEHVFVYGDVDKKVERVAVMPGSGKSFLNQVRALGAQVYITGDYGHHEGLDAVELGIPIIDATHYGLEYIFISYIKEYLEPLFKSQVEFLTYEPESMIKVV